MAHPITVRSQWRATNAKIAIGDALDAAVPDSVDQLDVWLHAFTPHSLAVRVRMAFTISICCFTLSRPFSYLNKHLFHPVAPYPTEWGSEGIPPGGFSPPYGQSPVPARVFRSFAATLRCDFNRPLPDSSGIAPLPVRLTGTVFCWGSVPLCFLPRSPCRPLICAGSECL